MSGPNMNRALRAWGANPPDWIVALAERCDGDGSQVKIAAALGVSPALINQTLGNSYKGRLDRIEQRVRGELLRETVTCPVLGPISKRDCLDYQARPFRATNATRVRLHQTCPSCPNREGGESCRKT